MTARIASLTLALMLTTLTLPGIARADTPYHLLIGGRPTDGAGDSARLHDGVVFVNLVRMTKSFSGLLTFGAADKSALLTANGHTIKFVVSSKTAQLDGTDLAMTAAPFLANGDTYVPLTTFASVVGATFTTNSKIKTVMLEPPTGTLVVPPAPSAT